MFTNRSDLLLDNPPQLNYGVCVTDFDGDGQFEVVVAGFGYPNRVFKWTADGLRDVAPPLLADANRQAIGVAACDIDGDGIEEIYVLNTDTFSGQKRLGDRLFARGDDWVDLFSLPYNTSTLNLTAGRSVAAVDRNGDGRYGMFIANYGGPMRLYELDDDGIIRDVGPEAGIALVTGGRGLVSLPLVNPHAMDIFAGNERGPNFLFRNNGDGTFTDIAAELGVDDPYENVRGIAVVDAAERGRFDLVYGNWEGPHRVFVQSSDGHWDDIAPPALARPSRVRTVIAADFDNDGVEELFFNNIGQPNRLFRRRQGNWVPVEVGAALEPDGLGTGAAVGDFDGDGRLELLVSHGESGAQPLSLYRAEREPGHHWLRILPRTRFGAPARGALVEIVADGRTRRRAIDAGSGYLCQMEPVAHFGLGRVDSVAQVTITWPDGTRFSLDAPPIDTLHDIPYPAR